MPDENVTSPQPTNPTPNPSQGINWKNIIIGVIIGAVLLGGGGYLAYNAYQPKKEEPAQTPTTTTKTATPSTTTKEEPKDETADWKTYKDNFYNISYSYPENWEEKTKEEGVQACQPSVGPKSVKDSGFSICEFGQSSAETQANLPDKNIVSMRKNLTVSGKTAIRQVVTENSKETVYAYIDGVGFKGQTGTITIIGWSQGSGLTTEKFVEIFDQILSTFRFD